MPELKRVKQLEKDISIIESKKSRLTDLLIDGKIEQMTHFQYLCVLAIKHLLRKPDIILA